MCGIVGYIGKKQALSILVDGLKKLEYRGYDSSGVCVLEEGKFAIIKKKGKVAELEKELTLKNLSGNIGIAHTRWATHGVPSEKNAHPHLDCKGNIAIVHNGIVENYAALKKLLQQEGHVIISDTDSEIIAHVIEKFYDGDIEKAVASALALIEGAYALAILEKSTEKLVIARKSSPLVIGVLEGGCLVASDVSAIINHTKKVVYLDDNEIAVLTKNGYTIKNIEGTLLDKKIEEVATDILTIEKKGFKYFMEKEIFEQPEAISNTLRGRIKDGKVMLNLSIDFKNISQIIITACGTSWHSALLGKYLIEKYAKLPVQVDYASEFRYRDPIISPNDLVVVISQSGETADTLAALKEAKLKGAKTLGIVNVVGSSIAREVDEGIYLHAGPEIGVASTKAFTCQVSVLLMLALHIAQKRNVDFDKSVIYDLEKVPETIQEVLKNAGQIRVLAGLFKDSKNCLYLGRNTNFPVALEGALKLKEISYIHAEGYPAAEMKHGPIALIDEHMPVVFLCPKDSVYQKTLSNMEEIRARGGNIISITNEKDEKVSQLSKSIIYVPKMHSDVMPIINVIPLQLLAYHIADLKGLNVDKPRNLAKSVTVE